MKRVLFVDDDSRILDGLQRVLRPLRREWEMSFAVGGQAAIDTMMATPFDVLVTDIRMPGIDGVQVLKWTRDHAAATVRLVLSGHADQAAVVDVAMLAHQFLAKPCDGATLREAVERACRLHDVVVDPKIRTAVGRVDMLPVLPAIWTRLNAMMDRPEVSVAQLAALIEEDIALCAKVLQLVNSAFFGPGRQVTSARDAVVLLGLGMLRSVVLAVAVFEGELGRAKGVPVQQIHDQSVRVALLARKLANGNGEGAFAAGLLHDVGKLLLARAVHDYVATLTEPGDGHEAWAREVARYGFSHAEVGGYLLALWGLPASIVEAVVFHHRAPELGGAPSNVDVVYLANQLADGGEIPSEYLERLAERGYRPDLEAAMEGFGGK